MPHGRKTASRRCSSKEHSCGFSSTRSHGASDEKSVWRSGKGSRSTPIRGCTATTERAWPAWPAMERAAPLPSRDSADAKTESTRTRRRGHHPGADSRAAGEAPDLAHTASEAALDELPWRLRLALQGSKRPAPESCQRRGEGKDHPLPIALARGVPAHRGEETAARLGDPLRPHVGNRRMEVPLRRKTEGVGGGDEPTHRGRNAAEPRSSATAAALARSAIASANRAGRLKCDEELRHQALASCAGQAEVRPPPSHHRSPKSSQDVPSASPRCPRLPHVACNTCRP